MKFDGQDLKRLQWAIAFLVIMTLVGVGVRLDHATTENQQRKSGPGSHDGAQGHTEQAFQGARGGTGTARQDCALPGAQDQGYIGPEKRLDWIETLARIKTSRRIFRLDYEFAPQRPADAAILPGGAAAGGFEIMASQMKLQLQLLHEGELLAFMAELRESVQALIQVRSCTHRAHSRQQHRPRQECPAQGRLHARMDHAEGRQMRRAIRITFGLAGLAGSCRPMPPTPWNSVACSSPPIGA
jgi:hypothetical protein